MFESLRKRLRNRIGLLLGHPEIYLRLDQLEAAEGRAEQWSASLQDRLSAIQESLSILDARLHHRIDQSMLSTALAARDHTEQSILSTALAARDHTDATVAEQQRHALRLAELHTEAAITDAQRSLRADLRAEIDEASDAVHSAMSLEMDASSTAVLDQLLPQLTLLRRRFDSFDSKSAASGTIGEAPAHGGPVKSETRQQWSSAIDAELYAALEDEFRGDSTSVKDRQKEYLSIVTGSGGAEYPVVDLGCGRGEWLTVLAEAGVSAVGIDSNRVFVDEARGGGLNVEFGNLLEYLRAAADQSVRAITLFQVLEHLPFEAVAEVIDHAARVLLPGGVLIAEVPNAKNLRVGAGTFWIDPTHERPWYPDVLEFLARMSGFSDVGGLYLNPALPAVDVDGVPPAIAAVITRLSDAVDGAQDYALVARV